MSENPSVPGPGNSQAKPSGLSSEAIAAIAAMTTALAGLSNREAREVVTMVAASRQLRVTSMMAPIGSTQGVARPAQSGGINKVASAAPAKKQAPPPPAAWKQDAKWKEASAARATIVAELKECDDNSRREVLIGRLRSMETSLKTLKQQLQGKGEETH